MRLNQSNRKRRTAATGGYSIRVAADNELRALQAFGVVDFRAEQVLVAHRVDQENEATFFDLEVVIVHDFVESEAVLEAGAAAAVHEHAQFQIRVVFFGNQLGYLIAAAFSEDNGIAVINVRHDLFLFLCYAGWAYCGAKRGLRASRPWVNPKRQIRAETAGLKYRQAVLTTEYFKAGVAFSHHLHIEAT